MQTGALLLNEGWSVLTHRHMFVPSDVHWHFISGKHSGKQKYIRTTLNKLENIYILWPSWRVRSSISLVLQEICMFPCPSNDGTIKRYSQRACARSKDATRMRKKGTRKLIPHTNARVSVKRSQKVLADFVRWCIFINKVLYFYYPITTGCVYRKEKKKTLDLPQEVSGRNEIWISRQLFVKCQISSDSGFVVRIQAGGRTQGFH